MPEFLDFPNFFMKFMMVNFFLENIFGMGLERPFSEWANLFLPSYI